MSTIDKNRNTNENRPHLSGDPAIYIKEHYMNGKSKTEAGLLAGYSYLEANKNMGRIEKREKFVRVAEQVKDEVLDMLEKVSVTLKDKIAEDGLDQLNVKQMLEVAEKLVNIHSKLSPKIEGTIKVDNKGEAKRYTKISSQI